MRITQGDIAEALSLGMTREDYMLVRESGATHLETIEAERFAVPLKQYASHMREGGMHSIGVLLRLRDEHDARMADEKPCVA